ncbi:MAG: corrinoid protein [Candidatus Verstraetearchaeota archaeon]|jgi:corrinoid protein of di/trimethylamine methyltransferase|nr:corrinoid protein [Candidatus Verstraetearchaeota archaeon]
MEKEEIFKNLAKCVVDGDEEGAKKWAEEAIKAGIDAYEAIMKGLAEGMKVVSEKYEKGEYYVPEVLLSASAMTAAVEILKPHIKVEKAEKPITIVIGVVEGDIHDIGKNLVKIMLESAGFKVIDLGRDVPLSKFVEEAKKHNADVIAMSALMTTTMPGMKKVIELLIKEGYRDKVKTIIGGAPTSLEYAKSIGADAWAKDASEAVDVIRNLVAK